MPAGGPRRFTLFFIPPRTKIHDYPEMAAELCAGPAATGDRDGCTPIAGSEAVYFGADQPRITAEALIPWSALGAAPPAAGSLCVSIPRSRRGIASAGCRCPAGRPSAAMRDPAAWRRMRLGDGPRMIESAPILPPPRPWLISA